MSALKAAKTLLPAIDVCVASYGVPNTLNAITSLYLMTAYNGQIDKESVRRALKSMANDIDRVWAEYKLAATKEAGHG